MKIGWFLFLSYKVATMPFQIYYWDAISFAIYSQEYPDHIVVIMRTRTRENLQQEFFSFSFLEIFRKLKF